MYCHSCMCNPCNKSLACTNPDAWEKKQREDRELRHQRLGIGETLVFRGEPEMVPVPIESEWVPKISAVDAIALVKAGHGYTEHCHEWGAGTLGEILIWHLKNSYSMVWLHIKPAIRNWEAPDDTQTLLEVARMIGEGGPGGDL